MDSIHKNYLFVHFRETTSPEGEQVYFAVSRDGFHWEALNDGRPILWAYYGDFGVRDMTIFRDPKTGICHIFATDLSLSYGMRGKYNHSWDNIREHGSKALAHWQSEDLVNWGEEELIQIADERFGCVWAPDVIYNDTMEKWCMYMSINGPQWNSSIVLLTADRITGPYVYQGPVIVSGFNVSGCPASLDYKNTDMELAIGTQESIPSRYTTYWGRRWPHCIDPCVFFDENGKLWMSYGSWSGGIWILELNEENGLRDYDVQYPSTRGNTDGVTSDPYFGKKIAGGFYSSGEGSYIEHIGDYYFLFVSNGGLAAGGNPDDYNNGGYQMRVFRSNNPNGPYVD